MPIQINLILLLMSSVLYIQVALYIFEALPLLLGVIYYKRLIPAYWKVLVAQLIIIIATELVAKYLGSTGRLEYIVPIYRYINFPVVIITSLFLLSRPLLNSRLLFGISVFIYAIAFFIEEIILPKEGYNFGSLSYQIGVLAIIILCLKYLLKLMKSSLILNFKTDMHFWLAIGMLVGNVLSLPFDALRTTIYNKNAEIFMFYWKITMFLSCTKFLLIAIGVKLSFGNTNKSFSNEV